MGWLRSMAGKLAGVNDLQGLDREQFEGIARDLNLSTGDLDALCRRGEAFGDLLEKRLAEFGLSEDAVKRLHPEVLRDLQRVCGNCVSTSRCARDFNQPNSAVRRSDYCANTETLMALEREDLQGHVQETLPAGPCCC
jgi:hypothetical protein